ncbi:MAG: glycosyltransferase family 2 protein [Lachnospiraceae bacterium]|nr:glycosyltransferase family 2 protein [Lachnospiraceae bacterium]
MDNNCLYIVVPCYNEEQVLPITAPIFKEELEILIEKKLVSSSSKILFVDDGSKDSTWKIIESLHEENDCFIGIQQSRNRGHQNAILAGMLESINESDMVVTIDCDGQDDIFSIEKMVEEYYNGAEIVYGVREDRSTDSFFKKNSAEFFYKFLKAMGVDVVYNHADFRLVSKKVLIELKKFREVNLYLRGMLPLVGFKSTCIYYKRQKRKAGKTHYPFSKMLALAFDGITSLSIRPIRIISVIGLLVSVLSLLGVVWAVVIEISGKTVPGWASTVCVILFATGVQLISIGVLGEYIGKIYMEVKARPRYIISKRIEGDEKNDETGE